MRVNPANTKHCPNADSMLGQRRRRWTNIDAGLGQCLVFSGRSVVHYHARNIAYLSTLPIISNYTSFWWISRYSLIITNEYHTTNLLLKSCIYHFAECQIRPFDTKVTTCCQVSDKLTSVITTMRRGRDALVDRLTASPVLHASWVETPLILCGFSKKYPCFSLLGVTGRSR